MLFFDTSDYARQLQKAGFTEHQAEVQVDALRTLIENDLATKQDLARITAEMRKDIAESKAETLKWIGGMLLAQVGLGVTLMKLL